MKRGSICWINLEPSTAPEFGKTRPGLVISNSEQNVRLPTVVILPLSTKPPEIWPLRIALDIAGQKKSFVVLPGIRQVDKKRIGEIIGLAPQDFLAKIDEALNMYLKD